MILIVDDDPIFLSHAKHFFASTRQVVLVAGTETAAMDLLGKRLEFRLALVDLSQARGLDTISAIRDVNARLPIIAISKSASDATIRTAKLLGANEALRKPIDSQWVATVDRLRRPVDDSTARPPVPGTVLNQLRGQISWSVEYLGVPFDDARQWAGVWYFRDPLTREFDKFRHQKAVRRLNQNV
ncbi:MAG TPA: response regulator [Bryobacteraceae bacterium]|nr:response regulator [Bryobacteraceae bacterium]